MQDLQEARKIIQRNQEVAIRYAEMIDEAYLYHDNNFITVDDLTMRKIGLCDHYRTLHEDTELSDEEILSKFNELNRRYEDENK